MEKSLKDDRMRVYLESAIVILIVTTISVSGNIFCGENERFSICGNNECRATCKLSQGPPSCDPKCRPGCICLKGLVRRERDNTCVKVEECFMSPSSGNFLQRRPGDPIPPKCPHIPQGRSPQCKRRFLPNGNLICGENERFSICGNNECRGTCELPRGKPFCDPKCHPGCICLKGLVRRERDKKCVKLEECYNSPPARNFLRKRPGCPPKKKQIPPKCPHTPQRRGPQCKRRFPQKDRGDVQGSRYLPGAALEADKKTELEKKLRKQYEEALNKIKDAIEKSEGLKDDLVEKLKEVSDKMKKNNIKIEEKAKDLFKKIKEKAKGAEKKILDKIYGEDNEEGTTSSSF